MAEYCTKCASLLGIKNPDIDVYKEFDELDPGTFVSGWICELCGLVCIAKSEEGELKVIRAEGDKNNEWENY